MTYKPLNFLRCNVNWLTVTITSEPNITLQPWGYYASCDCKAEGSHLTYQLDIQRKSISMALEPLVLANGNKFTGLKFKLKKESAEQKSLYVLEPIQGD